MDLSTIGKEPIPGDAATGVDVRYEPEFEALQAEIDKLSSPTASGQVDWSLVVDRATTILAEKSKDLTVASYLAVGLVHTRKLEGLGDGLHILADLLEHFWDDLFPKKKRMRGRIGAINWWLEKTEAELEKLTQHQTAAPVIEQVTAQLNRLDDQLVACLPDPPLLRPLIRSVESIPTTEAVAEPQTPAEPSTSAQGHTTASPAQSVAKPVPAPAAAQAAPAAPNRLSTDADAAKAVDTALQKIRQAAGFMLEQNLANPQAYAYRRLACWAKLTAVPPNSEGKTQIPPPAPQIRQALADFQANANWQALIPMAEQKLSQFIFWFDLNRYVVEALAALGQEYEAAAETIQQQTAFLLIRLPGIESLAFNDGTPFASAETLAWLQGIGMGGTPTMVAAPPVTDDESGSEADSLSVAISEAQQLVKNRKIEKAVLLLTDGIQHCHGQRDAFKWRLALVQLLMGARKKAQAKVHLGHIVDVIDQYRLEQWEPALALQALTMTWSCLSAATDKETKARTQLILQRIAALDAVAAFRLGK